MEKVFTCVWCCLFGEQRRQISFSQHWKKKIPPGVIPKTVDVLKPDYAQTNTDGLSLIVHGVNITLVKQCILLLMTLWIYSRPHF